MIDNYNIFLDDIRHPDDVTWVPNLFFDAPVAIVRSFEEFKNIIKEHGIPTFISYDHDLSVEHCGDGLNGDSIGYSQYKEKTGLDCCKFLVEECIEKSIKHPDYVVHSMNPVGRSNIISYIESYHKSLQ
jgi:hypothetical protein